MSDSRFAHLPIERLLRANDVCNRYERALRSGSTVVMDAFVAEVVVDDQALVRAELEAILYEHAPPTTQAPPAEIGPYKLEGEVGRGAMGRVFRAVHRTMKRTVAIKLLHVPEAEQHAAADLRFQREVEILAKLQHPNLVAAFDAGRSGAWRYLVTEYIDGIDLAAWVRKHGPMPPGQALAVLEQICRGLEYLHSQGVVHRDLKPANVMIDKADRVRILDVGLARAPQEEAGSLTRPGWILGTIDYMAPEQADGAHLADARSDLYGLGCTLHFLLRGKPPYPARTLAEAIVAHRDRPIPDIGIADVQALFETLVAKKPADRPSSATEVLGRLRSMRQASDDDRTLVEPAPHQTIRRAKPVPVLLLGALMLVVGLPIIALLGTGIWWFTRGTKADAPTIADYPLQDAAAYQKQWALHLNQAVNITDETGLAFIFVPPGRFDMGTSDAELATLLQKDLDPELEPRLEAEKVRRIEIARPFYLGATEVTIGQFRRFINATGRKTHAEKFGGAWGVVDDKWERKDGFFWDDIGTHPRSDDLPVFNITWDEAEAFCTWLNGITKSRARYRLPVEAEWEYACRAGSASPYCGGDHQSLQRYAWFKDTAKLRLAPVAQKQANAFGLFDMHGNHAEWCGIADRSSPLYTPLPDPADRPSRGGNFFEPAERVRSAARDWALASAMGKGGFRVLKEIP